MKVVRVNRQGRATGGAGLFDGLIVDSFAGGGGASIGIEAAIGRAVDVAINHDQEAIAMHTLNHPHTRHYCESVWKVRPEEATGGRPVALAWFSPDCKHFSRAKGGKPVSQRIRGLAWVVIRWAKAVRPDVIMLENVREFMTWGPLIEARSPGGIVLVGRDGKPKMVPCPKRAGQTFRKWLSQLRGLGYEVQYRTLNAADYGAATHRRRLFLIARRDGKPIVWPEPTHGPDRLEPYRQAAECIDWSIPCPSIFLTPEEAKPLGIRRPLKPKTLARIARGIKRFVIEAPQPFLVVVNHGGNDFRGQPINEPLATITGSHGHALATPFLTAQFGEAPGQAPRVHRADAPIPTITPRQGGGFPLVVPTIAGVGGRAGQSPATAGNAPIGTITAKNDRALIATHVSQFFGGMTGKDPGQPLPTITGIDHHGLVAASISQYNGVKGSEVRGRPIAEPLNTLTAEPRFAVVSAFLEQHEIAANNLIRVGQANGNGGYVNDPRDPLTTITSKAEHCIAATNLIRMNHGDVQWSDVAEPLRTVLAGANHHALVASFLQKYNGTATGQDLREPLHTATGNDRFALVMLDGVAWAISDIGLRMLTPRELFRCQGFPESYRIDVPILRQWTTKRGRVKTAIKPLPKSAQVRMVGNSVPPVMSESLVRANFPEECPKVQPARRRRRVAVEAVS